MAVKQRRKTFINPYTPVKRPSYKAEKYKGLSQFTGTLAKVAEGLLTEDDKKKAPKKYNTVVPYLQQMFNDLPYNQKLQKGAEAYFKRDMDYSKFNEAFPDIVDEDEFNNILTYWQDEGKVTSPSQLAKGLLIETANEGGEFDPKTGTTESFFKAVKRTGALDGQTDIKSLVSDEDEQKYSYIYNDNTLGRYIMQNSNVDAKTGALRNYAPLRKEVLKQLKEKRITRASAEKRMQQLANIQHRNLNLVNMMENARFRRQKQKAYEDLFQGANTRGMRHTDSMKYSSDRSQTKASDLILKVQSGAISYSDAWTQYSQLDPGTNPTRYLQEKRRLDAQWDVITDSVMPQPKKKTMSLDVSKINENLLSTDTTTFGRAYIGQTYKNFASNPERGAAYRQMTPQGRKELSYEALGLDGTLGDEEPTSIFYNMSRFMDDANISGKEFADILTGPQDAKKRHAMSLRIMNMINKYPSSAHRYGFPYLP